MKIMIYIFDTSKVLFLNYEKKIIFSTFPRNLVFPSKHLSSLSVKSVPRLNYFMTLPILFFVCALTSFSTQKYSQTFFKSLKFFLFHLFTFFQPFSHHPFSPNLTYFHKLFPSSTHPPKFLTFRITTVHHHHHQHYHL